VFCDNILQINLIIMTDITSSQPSNPSAMPLKPPPQPLDLKKTGMPPLVLLGIVVIGFTLAGLLFSFLVKALVKKSDQKKKLSAESAKPKTLIEVKPEETVSQAAPVMAEPPKELPSLNLGGILFSPTGESYALINGKVVPEGSQVLGVTVTKVLRDKVEMTFEGRKFTMRSL
jgi:hypothetical protein